MVGHPLMLAEPVYISQLLIYLRQGSSMYVRKSRSFVTEKNLRFCNATYTATRKDVR